MCLNMKRKHQSVKHEQKLNPTPKLGLHPPQIEAQYLVGCNILGAASGKDKINATKYRAQLKSSLKKESPVKKYTFNMPTPKLSKK